MGRGGTPDLICDLNHPLHILATGSLLAGAWCWWRMQLQTTAELLALGVGLSAFMAAFDITLARTLMRRRWPQVWADFNPASGNYLSLGLAWLVAVPWLVMRFG